ncbi:MAG: hypothetical protein IT572_10045 [Deltaproteobacteria bacterium]|nr:hypothetical protein [Deltaproteobacteria bacterium]
MSEINISILSRLLSSYLQERPDVQGVVRNILSAADGDGQANEEDQVLTDIEARRFIERQHDEARTMRQRLSFLTSRRDALVGTLQAAQDTLRRAGAPEPVLNLVRAAAEQDSDRNNLSLPELNEAIRQIEEAARALEQLNGDRFFHQVEDMVRDLRAMEREGTEVLLPETVEAQRAAIDLNFLKSLEEGDWQAIVGLARRGARGEEVSAEDVQIRFYMTVLSLLNIAGIDPANRSGDWRLSFENLQAALARIPLQEGERRESPELMMAELRYAADSAQQDLGRIQGQRLLAHPERTDLGVSLRPLIDGRPEIFSSDPRLQLFRDESGEDGILTVPELARSLRHLYRNAGGTPPNPAEILNELRVLVTAQRPETPAADAARARGGDPFIREMNRLVLEDLERMRDGFTERDRQLVDTMEAWDVVQRVGSNIVTLGGLTTGGSTYVELRRGFAELAATRRDSALAELRRWITYPDAPSAFPAVPNFQTWLSRRSGAEAQVSIPNAMEYLRRTQPATAAMLDGPFFQATRLWNIRREADADRQARQWLSLANDLRGGYRGEGVTSVIHAVPNLAFSRAILHALRRESTNPETRREARVAFQDSMGYDITDDQGNVTQGGNGELGLWVPDWFRNYPDEAVATAPSDAVFIGASLYGSGVVFRGFRGLLTAAGRRELMVGLSEFAGVRSTAVVQAAASESLSLNSPGWFGRWMIRGAERRVAAAEAQLTAATTEAELTAARNALSRAQNVHRILTAPLQGLAESGTAGAVAATGLRGMGYVLRGAGWLVDQGIPRYAIASQLFTRFARRQRFPLILDREYTVGLPPSPRSPESSAPVSRGNRGGARRSGGGPSAPRAGNGDAGAPAESAVPVLLNLTQDGDAGTPPTLRQELPRQTR